MIERIWSGSNKLYWLLLPLSWLYGLISGFIRQSYLLGLRQRFRSHVPVLVVGNLTAGGNGKTPVVIWLVEQLQQQGWRVAVISRGYGGHASQYPLLLDHNTTAEQAGDEPVLIFQRTQAPIAVAPKRSEAINALLQQFELDLIISDDGLQHYAMQRDCEWVVIDGERRFGNGWWLPAGPMRERTSRLASVNAIITNGGSAQSGEIAMQLKPAKAVNMLTGEQCLATDLTDVIAMAGIGNPSRFFTMLASMGVTLQQSLPFADHQSYSLTQLQSLTQPTQILLMTEKDAVKCRSFAQANWWYLPVEASFLPEQAAYLLQQVSQLKRKSE